MSLTGDQFRVLDILPYGPDGRPEDPIRCGYHIGALHELPEYETLSYRWGDPEPKLPINVCGEQLGVTRNLYDALFRLRRPDKRRAIWIDQLCINQNDNVEKAAQVRLMRAIYSSCTICNIWLDEIPPDVALEDAQTVFEFLAALKDKGKELPTRVQSHDTARKVSSIYSKPWEVSILRPQGVQYTQEV